MKNWISDDEEAFCEIAFWTSLGCAIITIFAFIGAMYA